MKNQDIVKALIALTPGAQWAIHGDTLDGIEWLDTVQTQPTNEAILAQIASQGK